MESNENQRSEGEDQRSDDLVVDAGVAGFFASMREVGPEDASGDACAPVSEAEPDVFDKTIGELFISLRGRSLMLSSMDTDLIQQWRVRGIPLHIAVSAIEEVMGNHKGRRVRSLSYCAEEVEVRYDEWCEMRVGAHV